MHKKKLPTKSVVIKFTLTIKTIFPTYYFFSLAQELPFLSGSFHNAISHSYSSVLPY